jgi:hypothetical protein
MILEKQEDNSNEDKFDEVSDGAQSGIISEMELSEKGN